MDYSQVGIMLFGCSAVWLVGQKGKLQRWGYIVGLCSQPFWFFSTWQAQQWGIFALCFWYTYAWGQGAYNHWGNSIEEKDMFLKNVEKKNKYRVVYQHMETGKFDCRICRVGNAFPILNQHQALCINMYTGLHDSQGKEIYEGDIVMWPEFSNDMPCVVEWDHEVNGFVANTPEGDLDSWLDESCISIGNIYETPNNLTRSEINGR